MHGQVIGIGGALVGIVGGGVVGFTLGRRYRVECARGRFWIASLVSVLLGMLVLFAGYMMSFVFISGAGVGLMTAVSTGCGGGWGVCRTSRGRSRKAARRPRQSPRRNPGEQRTSDQNTPHPVT